MARKPTDDPIFKSRTRHDGWTPHRQRAFLRALGETGCVRDACARAGISSTSAYRMRQRSVSFDRAWRRAQAKVAPTIEQAAYERAVLGWDEPVWHAGAIVGVRRRYSDNLLRLLLLSARAATRGEERAESDAATYQATQAETDAILVERLRMLRHRREDAAGRGLPSPLLPGTTSTAMEGDADDATYHDRWPDDPVRDGDDT